MDYVELARQKALKYGLNPDLFVRQIQAESSFNPNAVSSMRAEGLMQVLPGWKETICEGLNLKDVDDNIHCGSRIYAFYWQAYQKRELVLTVYNRGPSAVDLALAQGRSPANGYATNVLNVYERLQRIEHPVKEE